MGNDISNDTQESLELLRKSVADPEFLGQICNNYRERLLKAKVTATRLIQSCEYDLRPKIFAVLIPRALP